MIPSVCGGKDALLTAAAAGGEEDLDVEAVIFSATCCLAASRITLAG